MAAVILGSPTVIHSSFTGSIEVPSAISIGSNPINSGNTIVPTYYTKSQLRTSGESEMHWDNITNTPAIGGVPYPTGSGIPIVASGTSWGSTITDNSTDWDTAYGWGDHSTEGYLTTETDSLSLHLNGDNVSGDIIVLNSGNVKVHDMSLPVRNETGSVIAAGKAVYISGFNNKPLISLADNTNSSKVLVVGITESSISHEADGYVKTAGTISMDTDSMSAVGATVYLSTSGSLTTTKPITGIVVRLGVVTVKDNSGEIETIKRDQALPADAAGFLKNNGTGTFSWSSVTATDVGLGNVTNESKATMFTSPTFTGTATSAAAVVTANTKHTAAPASNATSSGIIYDFTAGENLAVGEAVYMKSDGKVWKADTNGSSTYPAIGLVSVAANAEATCSIITHGMCRQDTWNWTVGSLIYLSATPGALVGTATSTSGDKIQRIGVATHADRILVMPSLDVITLT